MFYLNTCGPLLEVTSYKLMIGLVHGMGHASIFSLPSLILLRPMMRISSGM